MIKRILQYSQEEDKQILKQKSEEVKSIDEVKELIQDLKDTLHSTKDGKGISAIQIGVPKKVCLISWAGKEYILINPKITRTRGEQEFIEGCLSVPFVFKKVKRAQKVWCQYLDENWQEQELAEGGRTSNIIQHELDHFDGNCPLFEKGDESNG